ncbi:hypothetical protein EDC32_1011147 [Laceyella sacchari]|jgi:hypothetical protein|nr:hypothetical protein EDC32_1011147 [Laceyella sacchari]
MKRVINYAIINEGCNQIFANTPCFEKKPGSRRKSLMPYE